MKICFAALILINPAIYAEEEEYPFYLVNMYDAEGDGWWGISAAGKYPVEVDVEQWLIGSPPSSGSAVTLPDGSWVELGFRGRIVDGPEDDIILIEIGKAGEHALVYLTDGAGNEYFLDEVMADTGGGSGPISEIGLDISGLSLPFVPVAVKVVGYFYGGASPGFDLNSVRARIAVDYCQRFDLNDDGIVNFKDYAILANYWMDSVCEQPFWCGGSDFDLNGSVNGGDLSSFAEHWLEYCYECARYDLNGDGEVDFIDFSFMAYNWLYEGINLDGDINGDNIVDTMDLKIFLAHWLDGC